MKNMSFAHTTQQCIDYLETVTRRNGWSNLRAGEIVQGVVKGMGLKAGEKIEKIHVIQIIENRTEPLNTLLKLPRYGRNEMIKEGFPGRDPADFVRWYCENNKKEPGDFINRIDFRYYLSANQGVRLKVPTHIAVCPSCHTRLTIDLDGWTLNSDSTLIADSFTSFCENEKDMDNKKAYRKFEESHYKELHSPYIYRLPVDAAIENWLIETFRFEL